MKIPTTPKTTQAVPAVMSRDLVKGVRTSFSAAPVE